MYTNSKTKTNHALVSLLLLVSWLLLLPACKKDSSDDEPKLETYEFVSPPHFPEPTYTFDNNPITEAGFQLGKKLFYDPILSRDGSVSCNNCHIQATAFADSPVHPISVGIDNRQGRRNAPSIVNMAYFPEFFWDGGVTHLDFVPINAIESEVEMGETVENVVKKLNASETYKALFFEAFETEEITLPFVLHALSQFNARMISANSKYDAHLTENEPLSTQEMEGKKLFEEKCATCHSGVLFTDFSYRNNGLDSTFADQGRHEITTVTGDIGKFRVPSLRNVALTAPYMHNARYNSLEEVLDHYAEGMVSSPSLDPQFIRNDGLGIPLSSEEKNSIISFLHTLTDREFTRNALFFND